MLNELCQQLQEKINEAIVSETAGVHKPSGFRASEIGHICARYQYHCRVDWGKRPAPDDKLAAIFALGRELETYVQQVLLRAGIVLTQNQVSLYDKQLDLTGRIDGTIRVNRKDIPVEIKSVNDWDFEKLHSFSDFLNGSSPWLLRWALQLPAYLWLTNSEEGIFILLSKSTGMVRLIPVRLDEATDLLDKAFAALDTAKEAMTKGEPPKPSPYTCQLCVYCWARETLLCPGVEEPLDTSEINVAELAKLAEICVENAAAYKRFSDAKKAIVEALKVLPVVPGEKKELFLGTVPVRVTCYERTEYKVPKEIKEQFATKVQQRRVELLGLQADE